MQFSTAPASLVFAAVFAVSLTSCSASDIPTSTPRAVEKSTASPTASPSATPVPEPLAPAGVFDDFQYGIPDGWLPFEEGHIRYSVPPGMASEDDDRWGDIHLGLEPLHTRPGGAGDVTEFKELVNVIDVTSFTESVYDGFEYELTIPGGSMSVLYDETPHESGITIVKGHGLVTVDGVKYVILFEFGEPVDGIPKMKQLLGTVSVS